MLGLSAEYSDFRDEAYPSLIAPGVVLPDGAEEAVKRLVVAFDKSTSVCSKASARRFRKSESWTRPTVCDLTMSSAVEACTVNLPGVFSWRLPSRPSSVDSMSSKHPKLWREIKKWTQKVRGVIM